ncbi:hypothetical protein TWF694_007150 [Orbilia ellipsospora]|uniref:F-box domain-containing protein n=1 Tax=Orbilia ellipsospora TaxID=2528407 RepID=A0AAV9XI94_9PEZI
MQALPEEIKDAIVRSLENKDLKNLRLASRSFNTAACRYLFMKLILVGRKDSERGYDGTARNKMYRTLGGPKHKNVEFCKMKDYLLSLLPIASYFTALEYAPVIWEEDLLQVRIGTHSGKEDDFCYANPYTVSDWYSERHMDDLEIMTEEAEIGNADPWVDKPYEILEEYSSDERVSEAAEILQDYVKEQEESSEAAKQALQEIISAARSIKTVRVDAWECELFQEVNFFDDHRVSSTTYERRAEPNTWTNYRTLIPVLYAAKHQISDFYMAEAPGYPFVRNNMDENLFKNSVYVLSNLQRLWLSFFGGTILLNSLDSKPAPGYLHELLSACQHTLKALRLGICEWRHSNVDVKPASLKNIFGGGNLEELSFSNLEELYISGFIAPATEVERLITSHPRLRLLWIHRVVLYARPYNWQRFIDEIINPSIIDRLILSQVYSGLVWSAMGRPDGGGPQCMQSDPKGWRAVQFVNSTRPEKPNGGPWVRNSCQGEVLIDEDNPPFIWESQKRYW